MSRKAWPLIPFLACALSAASAAETTFTSSPARTHLLELYTSEGCSSCPPAEAWFSKLKEAPGLWQNFVPIAFHVDYWDRLGWRDPFAAKAWTARQYAYSASWQSANVYTPGFVLDGREWRQNGVPAASRETPGILKLEVVRPDRVAATFQPRTEAGRPYSVHVARLGFDLKTNVKAGENRGRQLRHDFVVLALEEAPLQNGRAEVTLPAGPAAADPGGRQAIVAWVTDGSQMEPIQAVGGWRP